MTEVGRDLEGLVELDCTRQEDKLPLMTYEHRGLTNG